MRVLKVIWGVIGWMLNLIYTLCPIVLSLASLYFLYLREYEIATLYTVMYLVCRFNNVDRDLKKIKKKLK